MAEKKHAMYLYKDGESVTLFHGDDVEQAQADGWKAPDFRKSNGEEWNDPEGEAARDAAADVQKARAEIEKARAEQVSEPDMKVQIVEPAPQKSTARKSK